MRIPGKYKPNISDYCILEKEFGPKETFMYTLEEWLKLPLFVIRITTPNKFVCGIIVFSIETKTKSSYLWWNFIAQEYRGNGGIINSLHMMMEDVQKSYETLEIACNVRWTNSKSIFSLKKNGYRITNYMAYSNGEPGYEMKKIINQ